MSNQLPIEIKISFWNARGLRNKIFEVFDYIITNNIDVFLISETGLNNGIKLNCHSDYIMYRADRTNQSGGGVAIIIKKTIKHTLLPHLNTKVIEAIGISIHGTIEDLKVISAYFPGKNVNCETLNDFKNDILKLTERGSNFLVCGDLNSRHRFWNCLKSNRAGKTLFQLISQNRFSLLHPPTPTYIPAGRIGKPSILDVCLTNRQQFTSLLHTTNSFYSDHYPVNFSTNLAVEIRERVSLVKCYNKANWKHFQNKVKQSIDLNQRTFDEIDCTTKIDERINLMYSVINEAIDESIPKVNPKTFNYKLTQDLQLLIRLRNTRRRQFQRTKNPLLKVVVRDLNKTIQSQIIELRNKSWNNFIKSFEPGSKPFWKATKLIRRKNNFIPPLKINNSMFTTDQEKTELFAQTLYSSHMLTTDYSNSCTLNMVNESVARIDNEVVDTNEIKITTVREIKLIIKSLKSSKSPGDDGINNKVIKKFPSKLLILLTYIFNACMKYSYFPDNWKIGKVIVILKPNKDPSNPSSYRPITLLSSIAKLFERILSKRLNDFITSNNVLPDEQFGFRACHSTNHQIDRLQKDIKLFRSSKESTGVLLLDVERAFDTVWHNGLLHKLFSINLPTYLLKMFRSYLTNRPSYVTISSAKSTPYIAPAGVPQGAVLSTTFFNIFTADIPKPTNCRSYYYADDVALVFHNVDPNYIITNLENSYLQLKHYYNAWKIKINPDKSQCMFFTRRRNTMFLPARNIVLDNKQIPWEDHIKYLGVILDKRLTYKNHVDYSIERANKYIKILYPFINRRSELTLKNKLLLFKSIFRPILTYGCPVWGNCAKQHLTKLQICQNKILKIIYHLPKYFSTERLHERDNIEMISDFIQKLHQKYTVRLQSTENPLINELRS